MAEHLEMEYDTIQNVLESWEELRRIKDYDVEAGTTLFTHLFEKCPSAKLLFGFPLDMDPTCARLRKSRRFVQHAQHLIGMLDRALNMLGPDAELLEEMLLELGQKHVSLGVTADMFPVMGGALIQTMREMLGSDFTPEVECSWYVVYSVLSGEMISVMNRKK